MKEARTPAGALVCIYPMQGRKIAVHVDRGLIEDATAKQVAAVYALAVEEIKATAGRRPKPQGFIAQPHYWEVPTTRARLQSVLGALYEIEAMR